MNKSNLPTTKINILCIGAGIMSTTLAALLKKTFPDKTIMISEKLPDCGLESSASFNNAGTGHAGYCELQYSPMDANGVVNISKTLKINKGFQKSLDFWNHLVASSDINGDFMHNVPHYSFVTGEEDVVFLKKRYEALRSYGGVFRDMQFTNDFFELNTSLPLIMQGRDRAIPVAATKAENGLDVDFGRLSHYLVNYLDKNGVPVNFNQTVTDLYKNGNKWIATHETVKGEEWNVEADFVFIGAGGAAINLLMKTDIPEAKHYAGFPVSGQWLVCHNPEVVKHHNAKVYTNPNDGAPQMVAPHLDTRLVNGKKSLLFGPYAGATTKFLQRGSKWDLFNSIRLANIGTMLGAATRNMPMTKYLVGEVLKNKKKKFALLQRYYPMAKLEDWDLVDAGQRVQIIKEVNGKGVIEFGTEVVSSSDKTLSCLLGASPGASTSVSIMLDLMEKSFTLDENTRNKLKTMIPSYN